MEQIENIQKAEQETEKSLTFISVEEMARRLSIARVTAYQLTKTKEFPCFYIGKRIIIPLQTFYEWAEKQAKNKSSL